MTYMRRTATGAFLAFCSSAYAADPQDFRMLTDAPITRDSPNSFEFLLADQFSYDDNIYRLSSGSNITAVAGPAASRSDGFNSATVGGNGRWFSDIQAISLNFRADDNRYIHNDDLNNVSGKGNLEWDWRLGSLFGGQVGVNYYRGLSDPANTGYYARDVVQREDYFGTLNWQLGPHWALYGGFIGANTTHSAASEQPFDFRSKAGNAGIDFATSSSNTIALDYRYTSATFPQQFVFNGSTFNSDYNEQTARLVIKYVFSAATELDVSGGYLKRDYPESRFASFSGDIWRAALQWEPTDQLQLTLTGFRSLTAYIDAESDYFVSKGVSLTPTWIATQTLKLSLTVSRENHDYISSNPSPSNSPGTFTSGARVDRLTSAQGGLIYSPRDTLLFNLTARYDKRNSNQAFYQFNDSRATASITYKIKP
jgi:Putative beta-barrel porin 2